jgi:hypothetical protein
LRVVVSAGCVTCRRALTLVAVVRRLRPQQPVEMIDLDDRTVAVAAGVVGTPTYLLGERVVSQDNPSLQDVLATLESATP